MKKFLIAKEGTKWQRHISTKKEKSPFEGGFRGMLSRYLEIGNRK